MSSNTANNSASESVNTRPKWKPYLTFIELSKKNEKTIALAVGYLLTALLFFNLGRIGHFTQSPPVKIEEPAVDLSQVYDKLNGRFSQSPEGAEGGQNKVAGETVGGDSCQGKIKGNISSKSRIYHMPGGAFYDRTVAEACFTTEAEAKAAGFRKSQR